MQTSSRPGTDCTLLHGWAQNVILNSTVTVVLCSYVQFLSGCDILVLNTEWTDIMGWSVMTVVVLCFENQKEKLRMIFLG